MNGLELAQRTVDRWRSNRGNQTLLGACQWFVWYMVWTFTGLSEGRVAQYATALLAGAANKLTRGSINDAPVGSLVYWTLAGEPAGHVGLIIGTDRANGRKLVVYSTQRGDTVKSLSNGVKVSHADTYPGGYIGWSPRDGANPALTITPWDVNIPATPPQAQPSSVSKKPALVKGQVTGWSRASGIKGAPWWPTGPLMKRVQQGLRNRGRYAGKIDGIPGPLTAKGIQLSLNNARLNGKRPHVPTNVDGILGPNNAHGVQNYARKWGGYKGPLDGDPHYQSWLGFAKGINP